MRKDEVSQYNRLDSASLKPIHDHFPRIQINPTVSTSQFLVTSPGPWTVVNILARAFSCPRPDERRPLLPPFPTFPV